MHNPKARLATVIDAKSTLHYGGTGNREEGRRESTFYILHMYLFTYAFKLSLTLPAMKSLAWNDLSVNDARNVVNLLNDVAHSV